MMMKTATQAMPLAEHDDTLSAFLDGELSDDEARQVLRNLDADAAARDKAWSYMSVGDALRGFHAAPPSPHLTARVMAALEQEPTILAPMRKPRDRRASMWLAAAAIGAITWGLWQSLPDRGPAIPLAANDTPPPMDVQPYLAAHQDFAQAVISPAEMNFTQVSLVEARP
ncbi:MAG: sigma-E factor negative regulatory protein [Thiobacillus sp.]|nr:sigma-E factor negative regulatory protein [Thiobacillus sp.]